MKIIDLTCPKCGAAIKPDVEKGIGVCEYCGHQILIETEDTLEEIRAKAQSEAYGYHKGRLKAEEEAEIAREERKRRKQAGILKKLPIRAILAGGFALFIIGCVAVSYFSKPKVNPFDYIEVSFQGTDGDGELILEQVSGNGRIDINRIDYDISKEGWLSQGETISIFATSDDYRLSEKSKVYVVEGLDEYLKDLEEIPENALELIHQKAETVLKNNLDGTKATGYFVDMKPVKLFLLTDGKQSNELYDVFEVRFATDAGEQICYVMVCFDDVVIREGAQTSIDMSYGMYYGHLTQVAGVIYIMGYESLEEIRTDILTSQEQYMECKELDL